MDGYEDIEVHTIRGCPIKGCVKGITLHTHSIKEIEGNDNVRVLLIDDLRNLDADRVARSYDDGIKALKEEGPWDILLLDHDLGDYSHGTERTGEHIMKFLEENPEYLPKDSVRFVTSNPVGRQRMEVIRKRLYEKRNGDSDAQSS